MYCLGSCHVLYEASLFFLSFATASHYSVMSDLMTVTGSQNNFGRQPGCVF